MAKTKKSTKTGRKATATKKKAASPKKKAAVKKSTARKATVKKATAKKSTKKSAAKKTSTTSPQAKSASPKAEKSAAAPAMDRRSALGGDQRESPDRRVEDQPIKVERRQLQRRKKVNRRRQIDPTTCERDYTTDEVEFMQALDEYKRKNGRMFPTCSEILEVVRDIGYSRQTASTPQSAGQDSPPLAPPVDPLEESLETLA